MENFGLQIAEGSEITNLTIPTGTSFPANDNVGEMFYRTDEDKLYVRNNTGWGAAGGGIEIGAVSPLGAIAVPDGYLECDGSAVSRTTYADLFAIISTTFGVGDGATTFNLPDLRGEFIRGWDDARGIDVGRAIGTSQVDEFESHNHSTSTITRTIFDSTGGPSGYGQDTPSGTGPDVNSNFTGGTETRPRNVAMLYIIKY